MTGLYLSPPVAAFILSASGIMLCAGLFYFGRGIEKSRNYDKLNRSHRRLEKERDDLQREILRGLFASFDKARIRRTPYSYGETLELVTGDDENIRVHKAIFVSNMPGLEDEREYRINYMEELCDKFNEEN